MPTEADPAWGFGLDKLSIVNSKLRYVRPQLELNLHIDTANLTGLYSDESTPAQFTLAGKINGSPLRIDSQLTPFAVPAGVDVDINLHGEKILKHHVLISASTGQGKSNLVKVMSSNALYKEYCGMLILDLHNDYFGIAAIGL